MVPGRKVDAIIGFCQIRNFTDATEVLKETVMVFVNQVSEIVHGCVMDFHGAPNKNMGASFLVVWGLSGVAPERQTKLADMAIMSFIRILAEINKSRVLAVYRSHPGLQQRFPDYRVEMNFGLHCGWAIQGAIGSEFKIDASYLSPNVNVAARLEAATKQFCVWILISHFMVNLCSREVAVHCRLIDHVTVKGSKQPVRLYTIDMDNSRLEVQPWRRVERVVRNRFKLRQLREARKNEKWADDFKVWEAFDCDEDLIAMRSTYSTEFFQRFSMAYRNYEAGEWLVARDMLLTCYYAGVASFEAGRAYAGGGVRSAWPADGPTRTLLSFMEQTEFAAPSGWPGHRELTEK
jgi:class 3 adenylate cyclase